MQKEIGVHGLVKRGLESLNELMRKTSDEAHRVACHDRLLVADPAAACRRIERSEELIGRIALGARKTVEESRFSGVRVTHKRHGERVRTRARAALRVALAREALELITKLLHAHADHAAVEFDLFLAGSAGLAEAAALALKVSPAAHESSGEVLELGELHLKTTFPGLGAGAEDVENELRAVEHGKLDGALNVALLCRREGNVEDDDVGMQFMSELAELLHLARTDEEGRIGLVALGIKKSDGLKAVGLDEKGKLFGRVLVDDAANYDADEKGARGLYRARLINLKRADLSSPAREACSRHGSEQRC